MTPQMTVGVKLQNNFHSRLL